MSLHDFLPQTPEGGEKIDGCTVNLTSDIYSDDFAMLLEQLKQRNIKPGAFIAAGGMGAVYELESCDGKKIDSAVIRFDPTNVLGHSDNPLALEHCFSESNEIYTATIVPRAVHRDYNAADIEKSFRVFSADKEIERMTDLEKKQFMEVPGISLPVLCDISSITERGSNQQKVMGNAEGFCQRQDMDYQDIIATPVSQEEYDRLKAQKQQVGEKVHAEIKEKGLIIDAVASKGTVDSLEQVNEAHKGQARQ